ncbi:hypothetical protein ACH41H_07715 [Streptomyces sp. NPDC020800]|uniref:hypothetical protein n=1 Tax=Streptomyces sp. NPDC020800 TaxID=3365092 RepID=UPI00378807AD
MMTNPDMVFSTDPRHGLVARSGWEQEEARTVLLDLGWEWAEELHALVPPDDVSEVDAGLQAVEELHLHGHRTGYAVGPYGTMRLTLGRAEQVFTASSLGPAGPDPRPAPAKPRSAYRDTSVTAEVEAGTVGSDPPSI